MQQDRAAVEHRRLRRVGEQSRPDHRGRAAAPEPGLPARDRRRRMRTPARGVGGRRLRDASRPRLRIAPIVGGGAQSLFAAVVTGRRPVRVRGATPPVQVVHVDDAAAALELATDGRPRRRVQRRGRRLAHARRSRRDGRGAVVAALPVELRDARARGDVGDRARRRAAALLPVPAAPVRRRERPSQERGLEAASLERRGDPPRDRRARSKRLCRGWSARARSPSVPRSARGG